MSETVETDRLEGAEHPRHTLRLFGQEAAEAAVLQALAAGRMPHGWLLTGPRGVGKATLAWRMARFLLAMPKAAGQGGGQGPGLFADPAAGAGTAPGLFGDAAPEAPPDTPAPASLDIPADHPVARRIAALSEGRLLLIRRGTDPRSGRPRARITVDEVRRLRDFLGLSAPDGGWRAILVDAADEMTPNAANALLKVLEEPPPRTVLILISHQPAVLLPTIRSRCRALRLAPLDAPAMAAALEQAGIATDNPAAIAELAGGSVGAAISLAGAGGLELYARLVGLMATLPRLDRPAALALAASVSARGAEAERALLFQLLDLFLARAAATGAGRPPAAEAAPGEAALLARLAPDPAAARGWAEAQARLGARARAGLAVNLDPAALLLDMVLKLEPLAPAG